MLEGNWIDFWTSAYYWSDEEILLLLSLCLHSPKRWPTSKDPKKFLNLSTIDQFLEIIDHVSANGLNTQ